MRFRGKVGDILCEYYGNGLGCTLYPLNDLDDLLKGYVPYSGEDLHADYCDWRMESIELGRPTHEFLQESDEHIVNILILENVRCYLTGGLG